MEEKSIFDDPKASSDGGLFDKPSKKRSVKKQKSLKPPKTKKSKKPQKKADANKSKKFRSILTFLVVSAILIGGGVSACLWFVWYNSDDTVFDHAINNLLFGDNIDIIAEGNIEFSDDSLAERVDADFVLDIFAGHKDAKVSASFDAEATYENFASALFQFAIDAVHKDGDLFFKTNFTDLIDILGGSSTYDFYELEAYNGKWLQVSQEYLEGLIGIEEIDNDEAQTCIEQVDTSAMGKSIHGLMFDKKSGIIKASVKERKDKRISYDLSFATEPEAYIEFFEDFYALPVVSDTLDCFIDVIADTLEYDSGEYGDYFSAAINRQSIDAMYRRFLKELSKVNKKEFKNTIIELAPDISLTVSRTTRQVENITVSSVYEGSSINLDIDIKSGTRPNESVKAPTKYTDIEDALY